MMNQQRPDNLKAIYIEAVKNLSGLNDVTEEETQALGILFCDGATVLNGALSLLATRRGDFNEAGEFEVQEAKVYLKPVWVIDTHDALRFEHECQKLVKLGYRLVTASCGFVQSAEYDFCSSYQAIFALPVAMK